jgi:hypothetical protein
MFTPERSFFLVVLRHPLSTSVEKRAYKDCGKEMVDLWLETKHILFEDLKHLKLSAVVHYEHLATGDTLGLFD